MLLHDSGVVAILFTITAAVSLTDARREEANECIRSQTKLETAESLVTVTVTAYLCTMYSACKASRAMAKHTSTYSMLHCGVSQTGSFPWIMALPCVSSGYSH